MKVIVQIPCYNEEKTLPLVLADMPRSIPGVDRLETLVIDDGSTDRTVDVAHELGVNHIVRHNGNKGLAAAFQTGLDACLRLGADIIVNTDGDNQYPQGNIPDLVAPILRGEADMVVGDRQVRQIEHFSPFKKILQVLGSWVVRQASGTPVPDAPSGFRAMSREAALRLNVITKYTYTLETIVQAGKKNIKVASVPIKTNKVTRPSRLIRGVFDYLKKSSATIVRIYALYEPLKVFFYIGGVFILIGLFGWARIIYFFFFQENMVWYDTFTGHLPTVLFSVLALIVGFQIWLIGLLADLIAAGRRLTEEVLYRVKRMELDLSSVTEGRGKGGDGLAPVIVRDDSPEPIAGQVVSLSEEIPDGDSVWKSTIEMAQNPVPAYVEFIMPHTLSEGSRDISRIFDKFTEPARNAMQLARKEALRLKHNHIGTEHILMGLLREGDGVAAGVLRSMGITLQKVRSTAEVVLSLGHRSASTNSLTPRAVSSIELAEDEAQKLHHSHIGTEHLLLGLLREREGVAARVLHSLGVSLDDVRAQVLEMLERKT